MRPCILLFLAIGAHAFAHNIPCENCHGPKGERWVSRPACQSCHTGEIRYTSAFDADGRLRKTTTAVFGIPSGTPYAQSKGHGGLACTDCHGAAHDHPKMKVVGECSTCHDKTPATANGGPHGMHPVGESWIVNHGLAVDETGVAPCRACHGKDSKGSILSRAFADRDFHTRYGDRHFPKGTAIGCYSCHSGTNPEH